ncbi:hypothetical protein DFQ27_001856, partial [Actinomortierella ambigua]
MAREVEKEHVKWVMARLQYEEVVSMETFVQAFEELEEAAAHECFVTLLLEPCIPDPARLKVQESYTAWLKSHGPGFWAEQKMRQSATQAGLSVLESHRVTEQVVGGTKVGSASVLLAPDPTVAESPGSGSSCASSSTVGPPLVEMTTYIMKT